VVAAFTRLYYARWTHDRPGGSGSVSIGWLGHLAQKCPTDLWAYQEILVETQPDLIVETGSCLGGSGVFLATVCELLGRGEVISIDIAAPPDPPRHSRLRFFTGSSTDPDIIARVAASIGADTRVMVILDSDHSQTHVARELEAWADFVTPGHPILPDHGPGPFEAVDAFVNRRSDFVIDRSRERFLLTMNPHGYLRRVVEDG
jgi:cephalosporin hydroxylase